jgi:TPR repeat protein
MGRPAWLTLAYAARDAGDEQRAAAILREAASEGYPEALVRLAMMIWPEQESVADELVANAEAQVRDEDFDTHFALHQAYSLGIQGMAPGAKRPESAMARYQLRAGKAFRHLKVAAELDAHPRLRFSVGVHYWHGLNGVEKDDAEAEYWLSQAARSLEHDIVKAYRKFSRERSRKSRQSEA